LASNTHAEYGAGPFPACCAGNAIAFRAEAKCFGGAAKVNKRFPSRLSLKPLKLAQEKMTGRLAFGRAGLEALVMAHLMLRYAADERGASAIEYGLIAALISVAIIAALGTLGVNLRDKAMEIADAIGDA
jgi:pilus assembly protein Flp/PilA